jgi:hypothetical protein
MSFITYSALATYNNTTGGTSFTTGSASSTSGSLLLAFVHNVLGSAPTTPTFSGHGLTWDQVATVTFNTTGTPLNRVTVFRAWVTTGTSGTFVASFGATSQTGGYVRVIQIQGTIDGSGNNGSSCIAQFPTNSANATANPNITMSALHSSGASAVFFCFGNDINVFGGTAETDWNEVDDVGFNTPATGSYFGYRIATVDNTVTVTRAASDWGGIAVEVLSALNPARRRAVICTS